MKRILSCLMALVALASPVRAYFLYEISGPVEGVCYGSTYTLCAPLDEKARRSEIARMAGGGEQGEAPAAYAPAAPAPRANNAGYGSAPQGGGFVQVDEEELPF